MSPLNLRKVASWSSHSLLSFPFPFFFLNSFIEVWFTPYTNAPFWRTQFSSLSYVHKVVRPSPLSVEHFRHPRKKPQPSAAPRSLYPGPRSATHLLPLSMDLPVWTFHRHGVMGSVAFGTGFSHWASHSSVSVFSIFLRFSLSGG